MKEFLMFGLVIAIFFAIILISIHITNFITKQSKRDIDPTAMAGIIAITLLVVAVSLFFNYINIII